VLRSRVRTTPSGTDWLSTQSPKRPGTTSTEVPAARAAKAACSAARVSFAASVEGDAPCSQSPRRSPCPAGLARHSRSNSAAKSWRESVMPASPSGRRTDMTVYSMPTLASMRKNCSARRLASLRFSFRPSSVTSKSIFAACTARQVM
jgi:hypothetical protein